MEWKIEGIVREAMVHVPPMANATPSPLLFVFHGHSGTMKGTAAGKAYHRLWPEVICVYMQGLKTPGALGGDPEGKKSGWQVFEGEQNDRDLKFFDAAMAGLRHDYQVDDKRIYATGNSNGGAFTYLLWSARGERVCGRCPHLGCDLNRRRRASRRLARTSRRIDQERERVDEAAKAQAGYARRRQERQCRAFCVAKARHRRATKTQRMRRGRALGRSLHAVYLQDGHTGRQLYLLRRPPCSGGQAASIVKFFKGQAKP